MKKGYLKKETEGLIMVALILVNMMSKTQKEYLILQNAECVEKLIKMLAIQYECNELAQNEYKKKLNTIQTE